MKKNLFLIITCFLVFQTGNFCFAARILKGVDFKIRENGYNYTISLPNEEFGTLYNENNDQNEACFECSYTTMNNRRFEHIHVSFSIPVNGLTVPHPVFPSLGNIVVTTDQIKAWWDTNCYGYPRIPPFSGGGGVSFSRNCWGWAFGYNCWIQRPEFIYADNYDAAPPPNPNNPLPARQKVRRLNGHVVQIDQLGVFDWNIGGMYSYIAYAISEKNRESGIYSLNYGNVLYSEQYISDILIQKP